MMTVTIGLLSVMYEVCFQKHYKFDKNSMFQLGLISKFLCYLVFNHTLTKQIRKKIKDKYEHQHDEKFDGEVVRVVRWRGW